jgi:pantoate--beta-alanine ligase
MHHDLALPGEIIGCPTVRDADGLALSSRNVRLSEAERAHALSLPRAIAAVTAAAARGESDARQLEAIARSELDGTGVEVDYLALVDDSSLEPLQTLRPGARLLIAVHIGGIRLIDNAAVEPVESGENRSSDGQNQ